MNTNYNFKVRKIVIARLNARNVRIYHSNHIRIYMYQKIGGKYAIYEPISIVIPDAAP